MLLSSGLIAGESIMGVGAGRGGLLRSWKLQVAWHPAWLLWASLGAFLALAAYLASGGARTRAGKRPEPSAEKS